LTGSASVDPLFSPPTWRTPAFLARVFFQDKSSAPSLAKTPISPSPSRNFSSCFPPVRGRKPQFPKKKKTSPQKPRPSLSPLFFFMPEHNPGLFSPATNIDAAFPPPRFSWFILPSLIFQYLAGQTHRQHPFALAPDFSLCEEYPYYPVPCSIKNPPPPPHGKNA